MDFVKFVYLFLLYVSCTIVAGKFPSNDRKYLFPLKFGKERHYGDMAMPNYGPVRPLPQNYGPMVMAPYGEYPKATTMAPAEEKEKRLFCVVGQVFVILVLLDIEAGLLLTRLIWPDHYLRVLPPLANPIAAIFNGLTDMLPFPNVVVVEGRSMSKLDNSTDLLSEKNADFDGPEEESCHQWGKFGEVLDLLISAKRGEECGARIACEYGRQNPDKASIWRIMKYSLPKTYWPVFQLMKEGVTMSSCDHYICEPFHKMDLRYLFKSTKEK